MASLPPRPASQRRNTPRQQSSSTDSAHAPLSHSTSEVCSTISEDSQTVLLNSPRREESQETKEGQSQQPAPEAQTSIEDPKKCWICFSDETEDGPNTSQWRHPCPCALVAHESCLLDWIADMEAPNSRRRTGATAKILCPQCKSEIHLSRPNSLMVNVVRAAERFAGHLLLPGALTLGSATLLSFSYMHGSYTILAVFGIEDGRRILNPLYGPMVAAPRYTDVVRHALRHWRINLGLPLIPTVLIASRTNWADSILPILPMVFFTSGTDGLYDIGHWPPSAALSFAVLPYLRGAYNAYYESVWGERERKWLREIQPRAGTSDSENERREEQQIEDLPLEDGEIDIEINLEMLPGEDEWNEPPPRERNNQQEPAQEAHPLNAPPVDEAADAPPQQQDRAENADQQQRNPAENVDQPPQQVPQRNNILFSASQVADTILGALVFPGIAAVAGEMLKQSLPHTLTVPPLIGFGWNVSKKPTGLLQTKWGRSIVGGCMAVVLKDAILLYVRWKMAQNHRKRRVMDWDKEKGVAVEPPS